MRLLLLPLAVTALLAALTGCISMSGTVGGTRAAATAGDGGVSLQSAQQSETDVRIPKDTVGGGLSP